jgi:hypothetical protein
VKLEVAVDAVTTNTFGLRVFECSIAGDGVSVRANLNVFMPKNVDEFLQGETN